CESLDRSTRNSFGASVSLLVVPAPTHRYDHGEPWSRDLQDRWVAQASSHRGHGATMTPCPRQPFDRFSGEPVAWHSPSLEVDRHLVRADRLTAARVRFLE